MPASFQNSLLYRFDKAVDYEWMEANGLGGYASSTVIGTNTRKYHGLLVTAQQPPVGRHVMLSKLDETLWINGKSYELGANKYQGSIYPEGYIFQQKFERDLFPVFEYRVNQVSLRKTIAALNGENTTLVMYEVLEAEEPCWLELLPLVAGRDFHSVKRANGDFQTDVSLEDQVLHMKPYADSPDLYVNIGRASFKAEPNWYYNFEYLAEMKRRLDAHEDLFTPGKIGLEIKKGDRFGFIVSSSPQAGRDAWSLFEKETLRRKKLVKHLPEKREPARRLALAVDQFLVQQSSGRSTLVAGYPWFADWGRDTFIALPGVAMGTGRPELAPHILRSYAEFLKDGLIPNNFSDYESGIDYQSADASLWFVMAGFKYVQATEDYSFALNELLPWVREIVTRHQQSTHFQIFVDKDYLLNAGGPGLQLTWMDARVGDWLFTPRAGKAVEINALWYNVLEIYQLLQRMAGEGVKAEETGRLIAKTRKSFLATFWSEELGYLYDFVRGEYHDDAIRPNQLFAVSLPFSPLSSAQANKVLQVITKHLYTPFGLRTLSPLHHNYRGKYTGNAFERDQAYHHGTAWAWLMGPYIDALIRVNGELGRNHARTLVEAMQPHLDMAGFGTVSEIFDGDAPYEPRGCTAQAWSAAEWLRVIVEYKLLEKPAELLEAEAKSRKKIRITT